MKNKVKFFSDETKEKERLERKINEFLEKENATVTGLSTSLERDEWGTDILCMISYSTGD